MKPPEVADIHREICEREGCEFLDRLDYHDECAACPNGHWGRYGAVECAGDPKPFDAARTPSPVPPEVTGLSVIAKPGDLMAAIIFKVTGQRSGMCGPCAERVRQMNEWGWFRCWLNRKTILRWLAEEAAKRGHPIEEAKLTELLKIAFREARSG